jgi:hypothetical protein
MSESGQSESENWMTITQRKNETVTLSCQERPQQPLGCRTMSAGTGGCEAL